MPLAVILCAVAGLAILGGLLYMAGVGLFRGVFLRPQPRPKVDRSPLNIRQDTIIGLGQNWFYAKRMDFQDLQMRSYDSLPLTAYFLPGRRRYCDHMVILMHGYNQHPSTMAAFAEMYLERRDCHILIPHLRAHGMSGGGVVGYGLPDSQDLLMWHHFMEDYLGRELQTIYHGCDIGAVAVLMAAGSRHLPTGVRAVVADSPFSAMDTLLDALLAKNILYRLRIPKLLMNRNLRNRMHYGVEAIAPLRVTKNISVPVLLIHGALDTFIPPVHSEQLYAKIRAPKRMLTFKNAKQGMSYDSHPALYSAEVNRLMTLVNFHEETMIG